MDASDGASRFGSMEEVGDSVQEMTVQDDKSFFGSIDKRNNTSTLQTKAASRILKRETDEVLIPYVDKYRLSALAAHAGMGYFMGSTALSSSNIVEHIMLANAGMSNAKVPDTGRVLYMGYTLAVKLKLASQVVGIDKLGEKSIVNGAFGKIDKCQIRLVPDDYMPTGVHFMIVKTGVSLAPKKIETFRVINNSHLVDGALVQGRMLHDCFVLKTKAAGILVCMNGPYSVNAGDDKTVKNTKTYQLTPTAKLVSGGDDIIVASGFTYASSATAKATVDANGLITGAADSGTATITVTCGSTTDTMTVTCAANS